MNCFHFPRDFPASNKMEAKREQAEGGLVGLSFPHATVPAVPGLASSGGVL